MKFLTRGFVGVADHESKVTLEKFIDPRWWIQDGGPKMVTKNFENPKN